MKFTPNSIKNKKFNKTFKGYSQAEVESYLEELALSFETLAEENRKLIGQNEALSKDIKQYKKVEKSMNDAMLNLQEQSSHAAESARMQSQLMTKEAELKSSQILSKAKEEADFIRDGVLRLREEKSFLIARLKAMVESQAGFLKMNFEYKSEPEPDISPEEKKIVSSILEKL